MIYNLYQYTIDNTTGFDIVVNGFQPSSNDECVTIQDSSGEEYPWFDRQDTLVQYISRATDSYTARVNAFICYDLINKKTNVSLPEITINGTTYAAVTAWGIRPVMRPQYVGDDDNGRSMYSFSVTITTTI